MACRTLNYPTVQRWRRPPTEVLSGERVVGGRPPFDPFLTATMIWQGHLCPVAIIHELLHGISITPGVRSTGRRFSGSGDLWHEYIAGVRLRVASRQLRLPTDAGHALEVVHHDFDEWSRSKRLSDAERSDLWQDLVVPYATAHLRSGELFTLVGHAILPEVTVGMDRVGVPLGNGSRSYPIEARVDEIDLTSGTLIERTTLPLSQAAPHKMVQVCVAAIILRSLPAAGIPQEWAAVRQISHFVLETPTEAITFDPFSIPLYDAIHDAAAMIRDVAASELAEWPIYQQAQCTYLAPHQICSHPYINCFHRRPLHPQSRPTFSREIRRLCRAELNELLWQRDLNKYRLYNSVQAGPAYPGLPIEIIGVRQDAGGGQFVEAHLLPGSILPDVASGLLIVGTPFIGARRLDARIEEQPTGVLRIYCDNVMGLPLPHTAILWPSVDEGLLVEQAPDFLIRNRQRDLFALKKIGTDDQQRASQSAVIEVLEAIFGPGGRLET